MLKVLRRVGLSADPEVEHRYPGHNTRPDIEVTDMHGNPIELLETPLDTPRGDETDEERKPVVNAAFDADVWPHVSERYDGGFHA